MAKKWMLYHWQIPLAEEEIPMDKGGFRTVVIDAKKVINGLRSIKTYLASQAIETTDDFAREGFIESQKDIDDALFLLKEQEHKDRMFHALEDDWKRLKELLNEQENASKRNPVIVCPHCGKRVK